jgi:hypothetical protein
MSYRPAVEGIKTVLVTLLSKNPKLEETLQLALEEKFMDLAQVLARYNSRVDFIKLSAAKSIDEITTMLIALEKRELGEVYSMLPQELQLFYRVNLTLFDLDNVHSAMLSGDKKSAKLVFSRSQELEVYGKCFESRSYACLLKAFLESVRSSLEVGIMKIIAESTAKALGCLVLLASARYCKYALNADKLGMAHEEPLQVFLKEVIYRYVPKEPSAWLITVKISSIAEHLHEAFRKDSSRVTLYEATHVYKTCRELLLYSSQLIDLLTLYLVNRYYEVLVLKYVLPQARVFK